MILKSSRIASASGPDAWIRHVLHGRENEAIHLVYGSEFDVRSAFEDARLAGHRYGIRHWTINPGQSCDRKAAEQAVARLAQEFGFDPRTTVVVEHYKQRADGQGFNVHWHVAVPEYDPVRRRVLDSRWDRPRHEKIARILEAELGHQLTRGAHARAVAAALEAEGRDDVARALKDAGHLNGSRPRASFDSDRHQHAKRTGVSLPEARAAVRNAWQRSDGPEALNAALAESGLHARQGDKAGTWIVVSAADGQFIGAVHRLAGVRIADVRDRLSTSTEEAQHDPGTRRQTSRPEDRSAARTASACRPDLRDQRHRDGDTPTSGRQAKRRRVGGGPNHQSARSDARDRRLADPHREDARGSTGSASVTPHGSRLLMKIRLRLMAQPRLLMSLRRLLQCLLPSTFERHSSSRMRS